MLEKKDYEILDFLCKNPQTHINDILAKFPDDKYATKIRLKILSEYIIQRYEHIKDDKTHITNSIPTNIYELSDLGSMTIQNYKTRTKEERRREFIRSFFFPWLVALITTLSTIAIYKWLIPFLGLS